MDRVKLNELNLLKALGLKKIDKTAPANVGYNFFDESRIELIGGRIVFETFDTKDKVIKSSADSYDEQKAKALWEGSEAILGSKFLTI